jgi:hypothetical protein
VKSSEPASVSRWLDIFEGSGRRGGRGGNRSADGDAKICQLLCQVLRELRKIMLSGSRRKEPALIPGLTQAGPVELGLMTNF